MTFKLKIALMNAALILMTLPLFGQQEPVRVVIEDATLYVTPADMSGYYA